MPPDMSFVEQRRYRPEPMSAREAQALGAVTLEDYSVYTQRLASACDEGKEMLIRRCMWVVLQMFTIHSTHP